MIRSTGGFAGGNDHSLDLKVLLVLSLRPSVLRSIGLCIATKGGHRNMHRFHQTGGKLQEPARGASTGGVEQFKRLRESGESLASSFNIFGAENPRGRGRTGSWNHQSINVCYSNPRRLSCGSFSARLVSVPQCGSAKRESPPTHNVASILRFCRYVREEGYCLPPRVQTRYSPPAR